MALVACPALSGEASGKVGGCLVFSKWKGRPYVRSLARPANPKTAKQKSVRAMMKFLSQNWSGLSTEDKDSWKGPADASNYSPFNAFTSENMRRWGNFNAPGGEYPVSEGDSIGTGFSEVVTGGVKSIKLDLTLGVANDNWGVMVFRSTTTGFTTSFDNLCYVLLLDTATTITLVDSPLDPATYYYNFRLFSIAGDLGAEEGEASGTAT